MRYLLFLLILASVEHKALAATKAVNRPQRYAAFKAHTIMPESLRALLKNDAREMFEGLNKGMGLRPEAVTEALIMRETQKITKMIDGRSPFKAVIYQMGYVSGLVGVYTNPSLQSEIGIRRGFDYYLNVKLDRCLFVFDGYPTVLADADLPLLQKWISTELTAVNQTRSNYRNLLEDRYAKVNGNWRHLFNEQSAVFGVSSIYFSNMARLTAHLWYYAWASAHGDLTRTPLSGINKKPGVRKR